MIAHKCHHLIFVVVSEIWCPCTGAKVAYRASEWLDQSSEIIEQNVRADWRNHKLLAYNWCATFIINIHINTHTHIGKICIPPRHNLHSTHLCVTIRLRTQSLHIEIDWNANYFVCVWITCMCTATERVCWLRKCGNTFVPCSYVPCNLTLDNQYKNTNILYIVIILHNRISEIDACLFCKWAKQFQTKLCVCCMQTQYMFFVGSDEIVNRALAGCSVSADISCCSQQIPHDLQQNIM